MFHIPTQKEEMQRNKNIFNFDDYCKGRFKNIPFAKNTDPFGSTSIPFGFSARYYDNVVKQGIYHYDNFASHYCNKCHRNIRAYIEHNNTKLCLTCVDKLLGVGMF